MQLLSCDISSEQLSSLLSLEERKAIFAATVRAESRAEQQAEAKYPILGNNIPTNKLRTYDVKAAMEKKDTENERLKAKYEAALLKKFAISESELQMITMEGLMCKWPLPKR